MMGSTFSGIEPHSPADMASSTSSRRPGTRTQNTKSPQDVADMLEDENLAWGPPPSTWRGRKVRVS
ncbi:hypothetical protein BD414DRAFT_490737 [Trametes punicea]|nr:hypothetical protein BD414DRAFT_490737 [Trametes punicea]